VSQQDNTPQEQDPLTAAAQAGDLEGKMGAGNQYALDSDFDFHTHDLKNYNAINMVMAPLAAAPANPREGQWYYNTVTHHPNYYNGTAWVQL
jgi:hypothetical protein